MYRLKGESRSAQRVEQKDKTPIESYFHGVRYATPAAALSHALEISDEIKRHSIVQPRYEVKTLTPFHRTVAALFEKFKNQPSRTKLIALETLRQKALSVTSHSLKAEKKRVREALYNLKKQGAITHAPVVQAPRQPPSVFHLEIARIAPNFQNYRGTQYDVAAITREWMDRKGITHEKADEKKARNKVQHVINALKAKRAIPQSSRINRQEINQVQKRQASEYDDLIKTVLFREPKYGTQGWREFMNKLTLCPLVPDQGLKPLVIPALVFNYIGEV